MNFEVVNRDICVGIFVCSVFQVPRFNGWGYQFHSAYFPV